jgi:long-chain acyl-CoA synthetase
MRRADRGFVVVASGPETTGQELLAWCREHLAAQHVPAFVTFTGRLPRNSVGKLIRAGLQNAATLTPPGRGG